MRPLYEIDNEIRILIASAEVDEDGEYIIDIDKLNALQMERTAKLTGVAVWVKNLMAEADMLKAEKKKLADRQQAVENKVERLKSWLKESGEPINDPRVKVSFRKSPDSVEVFSTERLPSMYFRVKTEPDKTAIKKALQDGKDIPGARLITDGISITIK